MWQASEIENIGLSHGQARWIAVHLNLRVGDDNSRFDAYLKALRRAGVPFSRDETGVGAGHNLLYRYEHLMEVAVALFLRAQAMSLTDVASLIVAHRSAFRDSCYQAYIQGASGLGTDQLAEFNGSAELPRRISGCYLTFMVDYQPSGILFASVPRLIGPIEAFDHFMGKHDGFYPRPPVPVSELAERIVNLVAGVPVIRRGPR